MKKLQLLLVAGLVTVMLTQCNKMKEPDASFMVKIENVSTAYDYFAAGAVFIPDGESEAGPAFPGHSFTIQFHAGKGHKLSFATMFGASNDLFYAPDEGGIMLFDGDTPLTGDITDMISLWDAGTEVNHAPGSHEDGADEAETIQQVRNTDNVMDGFTYNNVEDNMEATLEYDGTSMFTLTLNVLENSQTPLSPVAWVVHSDMQNPIFTEGEMDSGHGLEDLAETGNAEPLSTYLEMMSGYVSPISPGVWVLHAEGEHPVFEEGKVDYGAGLESLAELGDPTTLHNSIMDDGYETGVYNIPDGATEAAPIFPGESFTFTVDAHIGDYLSLASMLGKSNDLFFAPSDMGIKLFDGETAISTNVSGQIKLWDAGTETNEYPGAGIHQGMGDVEESENVMMPDDDFVWPSASDVIKVTITAL